MADEKKAPDNSFSRGDPRVVEIDTPGERSFWCKVLDISEEELLAAVAAVGHRAQDLKEYFARKRGG